MPTSEVDPSGLQRVPVYGGGSAYITCVGNALRKGWAYQASNKYPDSFYHCYIGCVVTRCAILTGGLVGTYVGSSAGPLGAAGGAAGGVGLGAGLGAILTNILGIGEETRQFVWYGYLDWQDGGNRSANSGWDNKDLGYNAWGSAIAIESPGSSCEAACARDYNCTYPAL